MPSWTLQDKKTAMDTVVSWLPYLNSYEFTVLMQLTRMTIGYGREKMLLAHHQMLDGIANKDETDWYFAPLKNTLSLNTLRRTLISLEEKKLIIVERFERRASNYAVNTAWRPDVPLAIPKRLKTDMSAPGEADDGAGWDGPAVHPDRVHPAPPQSAPCTPTECVNRGVEGEFLVEEKTSRVTALPESSSSFEISDSAQSKIAAVKNRSGEKLKPDASFEKVWRAAMAEAFPQATFMGWTVPQKGMMNGLARKWTHTTVPFSEFVDWSVRNWRRVLQSPSLSWCTNAAPTPDLMFFIKATFNGKFLQEFTDERLRAKDFDYSAEAEYKRLTYNEGLTHDKALLAIGESKGVIKTVRRLNKEKLTEVAATMQAERERDAANNARKIANRARAEAEEARKKAEEPKPAGSGSFDNIDLKSGW